MSLIRDAGRKITPHSRSSYNLVRRPRYSANASLQADQAGRFTLGRHGLELQRE